MPTISDVHFQSEANDSVVATIDDVVYNIPYSGILANDGEMPRKIVEWTANGNVIAAYTPPPPTSQDVEAERTRRLANGFSYDFGDARGVHHIGTTDADMKGWDEVTKGTQALMNLGMGNTALTIVTDTGPTNVTAQEWQQVLVQASVVRQPIWAHSFALSAMDPVPRDFANDSYWT